MKNNDVTVDNTTSSGIVPKLRFPEFRNAPEWKTPTLKNISHRIVKKVGNLSLPPVSITAGAGFVTQQEKFGRDISGDQYKNYILLNNGNFAYNKGNSKKYPQGCICKLKEYTQVAAPNAFICFQLDSEYIADFFQNYFDINFHGRQLKRYITSGARSDGLLNINPDDFFRIVLPMPSPDEQQKIADCLTSVDELISAQAKKLEALKLHKKGLMQQLFPAEGETVPKLRFPEFKNAPEFEEKQIEDFFDLHIKPQKAVCFNKDKIITVKLHAAGIVKNEKTKALAGGANYFKRHKNQFIFSKIDLLNGAFGLVPEELDGFFSSSDVPAFRFKVYERPSFFLNWMKANYQKLKIERTGTSSTLKRVSVNDFLALSIWVPHPNEQQKIADCLSSIDELIAAQSKKLEALKMHKKGLRQQLFPSADEVRG